MRRRAGGCELHELRSETGLSTCLEAGGPISHHHGIGRRRTRRLPDELGELWHVLAQLRRTLDPIAS